MHMNLLFKPCFGSRPWVINKTLCSGSSTGWVITQNGKISCFRVDYYDYINFEIEILSPAEIAEYKKQFSKPDEQLFTFFLVVLRGNTQNAYESL